MWHFSFGEDGGGIKKLVISHVRVRLTFSHNRMYGVGVPFMNPQPFHQPLCNPNRGFMNGTPTPVIGRERTAVTCGFRSCEKMGRTPHVRACELSALFAPAVLTRGIFMLVLQATPAKPA
jgi:hypothetical protein